MNIRPMFAVLIAAHALCACATTNPPQAAAPVMDLKRVNPAKYEKDLGECRVIADAAVGRKQAPASATQKVKTGVVGVAKAGVRTVAKTGVNVVQGAPTFVKELTGDTAADRSRVIVSNCLKGRGYAVLE
jgi:hypothetical protein